MKKIVYTIQGLLFIAVSISSYGQQVQNHFYYYKGEKIILDVDKSSIAISLEGENNLNLFKSNIKGKSFEVFEDHTRKSLITTDPLAKSRKEIKTYYLEIETEQNNNESDYFKKIEECKVIPGVLMASPCFKNKEDKKTGLSNNFYVKLKREGDVILLYENAKKLNMEILGRNEFMPLWFTLSCIKNTKLNAMEAANLFYETGLFESTEPEFIYHDLVNSPNDPFYTNQWGLKNTGQFGTPYVNIDMYAEQAWTITTGSTNIKTAVFDQGFEFNHPDLQANVFGTGYDAETNTTPAQLRGRHGTPCAGIVSAAQNNNLGVSGVAPTSKIFSVSISLSTSNTPQQFANGFNWAWQNGADIISNSWGGPPPSSIMDDAITNTLTNGRGGKGTVVVFAAGNDNNTGIDYPGVSNPLILVVGALSPCGERKDPGSCDNETWWGSDYGTQLDVMAPGVKIPTTDRLGIVGYDPSDYTQTFNGSSAACPHVAGVAALVLTANPNLTVQQVNDVIEQSAQKVRADLYTYTITGGHPNGTWNMYTGYGLVNAYQAVLLANPCTADFTVTTNVNPSNVDYRQTTNSITATNIVFNGASAFYHAGNYINLNPGFYAENGSVLAAYIEGCTGIFHGKMPLSSNNNEITNSATSDNTDKDSTPHENTLFKIYPNPSNGIFTVMTGSDGIKSVYVYNILGDLILSKLTSVDQQLVIDISQQDKGVYFVKMVDGNTVKIEKIIHQ